MKTYLSSLLHAFAVLLMLGSCSSAFAQLAKVVEAKVTLPAGQLSYRGPCPVELEIGGMIRTDGPGLVKYQFVHTTGPLGPVQRLVSLRAGDHSVRQDPRVRINGNAQFWNDTVVLRVLSNPAGSFDSSEIKYTGACQGLVAAPRPTEAIDLGPAQARFRVTLNGFTCNTATRDGVMPDGSGDEVLMLTKTFNVEMDAAGTNVERTSMDFARSFEYGDVTSGFRRRIRAGSSRQIGSLGGVMNGDSYPESPGKYSNNPQNESLPQLVWEGMIARFKNAVVILPTIWEIDGRADFLYAEWERQSLNNGLHSVGRLIQNPAHTDQALAISSLRAEVDAQTRLVQQPGDLRVNAHPGDLPIGMRETSGGMMLKAQLLILTYDEAVKMSQKNKAAGQAFPIRYVNDEYLGGGDYTLWMQVEQLP
ncbi:MAG: hypothetical protein ABIO91_00280 [Pyrinomonadaceae bacterium]